MRRFKSVEMQCEAAKKLASRLNNVTIVKKVAVEVNSNTLN